jgi:hypothetical protein
MARCAHCRSPGPSVWHTHGIGPFGALLNVSAEDDDVALLEWVEKSLDEVKPLDCIQEARELARSKCARALSHALRAVCRMAPCAVVRTRVTAVLTMCACCSCSELVWQAGTIMFVPQGWLHATLNLDDTVGISMELGPSALV